MSPEAMARTAKLGFDLSRSDDRVFPSIIGALDGVSAEEARWRPEADSHSIWEITAHVNQWIELLIADLAGLPRERIRSWPKIRSQGDRAWRHLTDRLQRNVNTMTQLAAGLSGDELYEIPPRHRHTRLEEILGAMAFCAYNASRIAKLRIVYERQ